MAWVEASDWLLTQGAWDDSGAWDDGAVWIDGVWTGEADGVPGWTPQGDTAATWTEVGA